MKIVNYPHPTLRHKSKPLRRVDAELRETVRQMFALMYEHRGVGLAANQVDLPVRLFVVNLEAEPGKGEEMVFLNPVINRPKGQVEMEEGCLSLPGLYARVRRPERVHLTAFNLAGEQFEAELEGMFARVAQHELDHLDGVVFTDRLSEAGKLEVRPGLEDFEDEFRARRERGEIPADEEIRKRLAELEKRYC
ncbi:MAG: peptide deformylase [Planctomycetes bacterium]|nr:peptide deformylase [Planctomycetota bacterium]